MGSSINLTPATSRLTLSGGTELSYTTAGRPDGSPALVLLHGFPNSSRGFRDVIPILARHAHVIAPDLPGFGESEPLEAPSFDAFTDAVLELLEHLQVGPRFLYVHDFGAPVALSIAMRQPDDVLGIVIQNANAHSSGRRPGWAAPAATSKNASCRPQNIPAAGCLSRE
ncbi:alpha/beta hydrolase [Microbacterium sp. LWH7-1.2]|uniref:alpha/beta fold hydrolase n=1 Tax=Microbacterium sp. LWH7-1.2 TaxID=3135257 RepID=UPI003139804C